MLIRTLRALLLAEMRADVDIALPTEQQCLALPVQTLLPRTDSVGDILIWNSYYSLFFFFSVERVNRECYQRGSMLGRPKDG